MLRPILLLALFLPSFSAHAFPGMKGEEDTCLSCHGNKTTAVSQAPLQRPQFTMDWKMQEFQTDTRPPVKMGSDHDAFIHGTTYYDWTRQSMTEVYRERCIDIFPEGRDFPCRFTSIANKTYFMTYSKTEPAKIDTCCLWSADDFFAPRPDVIQSMKRDPATIDNVEWWTLDIPLPGPFGYGFHKDGTPAAFWFPVINGWVQQEFGNYREGAPEAGAFALPAMCQAKDVKVCQ